MTKNMNRKHSNYLGCLFALIMIVANPVFGVSCEQIFPGAIQTTAQGSSIIFADDAGILGASSATLATTNVVSGAGEILKSCHTVDCAASGATSTPLAQIPFSANPSLTNITVRDDNQLTVEGSDNYEIDSIDLGINAVLTLNANTHGLYRINTLILGTGSHLILSPGDYWVSNFQVSADATISVVGTGAAHFFSENLLTIGSNAKINYDASLDQQQPEKLFFYSASGIDFQGGVKIAAGVYATQDIHLGDTVHLHGIASAANISLETGAEVYAREDYLDNVLLTGLCSAAPTGDLDADGIPDAFDIDRDGDGFYNTVEDAVATDPDDGTSVPLDNNGNGIADKLEYQTNNCTRVFGNGVQSHNQEGTIELNNKAQILAAPTHALNTTNLILNETGTTHSCGTSDCYESGTTVLPFQIPEFKETAAEKSQSIEFAGTDTLEASLGAHLPQVVLQDGATLAIGGEYSEYFIYRLTLNPDAKIILSAGDYWIDRLSLSSRAQIQLDGSGPVRLFVGQLSAETASWVNSPGGEQGDASQLFIYTYDDTYLKIDTVVSGLVYSTHKISLNTKGVLYGSLAAKNIFLGTNATVHYQPGAAGQVNYAGLCEYTPDSDIDGYPDNVDAFPEDPNEWSDLDGDNIGDNSDPDRDNDGISNEHEIALGTDPNDNTSTPADADGDGLPDILETDADGDGFDNEQEITAGTDPADPNDYPDIVEPIISSVQPNGVELGSETLSIEGVAFDPVQPHSGLLKVDITSSRYPGTFFSGAVTPQGFAAEVPLALAENTLNIVVYDRSLNATSYSITVTRISPPYFADLNWQNGEIVDQQLLTLSGEVHTSQPLEDVQLFVNEWQITPSGTTQQGIYTFELENIPLDLGINVFELRATSSIGEDLQTLTLDYVPENADELPPPQITIIAPAEGSLLNGEAIQFAATIVSEGGPLTVSVNGENIYIPESQALNFNLQLVLEIPGTANELHVEIVATDTLDKTTTKTLIYTVDNTGPVIALDGNFVDFENGINAINASPYTLSGSVTDDELVSFQINGNSVPLTLTSNPGEYRFEAALAFARNQQSSVVFYAQDAAGNISTSEYLFNNTAVAGLNPLIPESNAQFLGDGTTPIELQVVARVDNLQAGESVQVLVNGSATPLDLTGTLASATLSLPSITGDYELLYQVVDASGVTEESSRGISILNTNDIPLEVVRVEPESGAQYIEPNAAIELYLNKSVSLADISLNVKETLHGFTYVNNEPLGLDFLQAKGYELMEVHRDQEVVPGALSLLPGGKAVVFAPERYMGFAGNITVELNVAGEEISRSQFTVRELPTFINGMVRDQFGQPMAGVKVELPELQRSTYTNNDGGYAFGYQESGEQRISGGRYKLLVNNNFYNPGFGMHQQSINVQQNRKNEITPVVLQEINREIPFSQVASGQPNSLLNGDLELDLSEANLFFANGANNGRIHVQFLTNTQLNLKSYEKTLPHWAYAVQPKGLEINGPVQLSFAIPELYNSYDYLPDIFQYVVVLGYNPELEVFEPVGVGEIVGKRVIGRGNMELQSLDYLGYALVDPVNNSLLESVISGEKSVLQLKTELQ